MTIFPIFKPSARIRERSPFDVGSASRMDLAAVRRLFVALFAVTAFEDFVLTFDEAGFATSAESSSSASTMTFLIALALADGEDLSPTGITLADTVLSLGAQGDGGSTAARATARA